LFIYTNEGKRTLLAQGSQKLNNNNRILAQYLNLITFDDNKKSFQSLKNAKLILEYTNIKNDFEKTKITGVALEIIDKTITEDEDHLSIYNELKLMLESETTTESVLSFALKILKYIGFGLYLSPDGRKIKGVSTISGGLVYENDGTPIDLDAKEAVILLKLYVMPYNELEQLTEKSINKIKEFVRNYYRYHLQTELKNL
jgi:DNA repair protein RecO (recombination protein O)